MGAKIEPLGPGQDETHYKRICAHGDPGAGKTSWARSIVTSKTLAIDCGGGLGVLADVLKPAQIIRLSLPSDLKGTDQDRLATLYAANFARAFEFIKVNAPDSLIVDNFNTVTQGLETMGRLDMEEGKAYVSGDGKPDPFALYAALANVQFRAVTKLCALPCHLYLTITSEIEYETERYVTDKGREASRITGKKWISPALAGKKILEPFIAAFDTLLYFHTERVPPQQGKGAVTRYLVRTMGTERIRAKIRSLPSHPIPDVLSIGQKDDQGRIQISSQDWTLAKLVSEMSGGTVPANEMKA